MPEEHAVRREKLRELLRHAELDALLVTSLLNIRYLTGFTGSNAALAVSASGEDGTLFATDGRYTTQSAAEVPDLQRVVDRGTASALIRLSEGGRWGVEAASLTVTAFRQLEALDRVQLVETQGMAEQLRAVKDETEIGNLRQACGLADAALGDLISAGAIRPGRTEREIGLDLDERMRRLGAEDPAFESIVAAGANSAIPHHRPTGAVLAPGDFVKLDFGARHAGYHSDMTRTLVLGTPAAWQREIYDVVQAAQAAGIAAARVGASCGDVDRAARQLIVDAGYGAHFVHGLGHGVGLEIHEAPAVGAAATGTIAENMVLTIEPGIYLEGRGGVRIEDSGVIRPAQYEVLTLTTKTLLAL